MRMQICVLTVLVGIAYRPYIVLDACDNRHRLILMRLPA